jgi:hypothetical protein
MKKFIFTLCILLGLSTVSSAQFFTLYYSDTVTYNGNPPTSATVTPTVSVTGDDGGYCSPADQNFGNETGLVLLNGNSWFVDSAIQSGGVADTGRGINTVHTFPSTTVPGGTIYDFSFAAKVQGVCFAYHNGAFPPGGYSEGNWFLAPNVFWDGAPGPPPSPCFIGNGSPQCNPFPTVWTTVPRFGIRQSLFDQSTPNQWEIAFTGVYWNGPAPTCYGVSQQICSYLVHNNCTPATSPPDFNLENALLGDHPYPDAIYLAWTAVTKCDRPGPSGPWDCAHGFNWNTGLNDAPHPRYSCTHNP